MTAMCESCGRENEPLARVKRVYLSFDTLGEAHEADTATTEELWCFVCREHYPHEPL